jgi:hypothetical protein
LKFANLLDATHSTRQISQTTEGSSARSTALHLLDDGAEARPPPTTTCPMLCFVPQTRHLPAHQQSALDLESRGEEAEEDVVGVCSQRR